MKLTHQRMTERYNNTPESLLYWLEEQLENRGIDAVVYTRYILSLLQDDDTDSEDDSVATAANTGLPSLSSLTSAEMSGFCCERVIRKQNSYNSLKENIKPVTTTKWKHKRYLNHNYNNNIHCVNVSAGVAHECHCWLHSEYCSHNTMNSDEERKLAVVQCLKSASEQEFGIESFVEELCAKLKNFKLLSETNELAIDCKSDVINNNNSTNGQKVSPKEQAMKYYAAFPALDGDGRSEPKSTGVTKRVIAVKDRSRWNGQKIIEYMSGANTGADNNGPTGEQTSRQTLTTANNWAEDCKQNSKTLEVKRIDKKAIDSGFVEPIAEIVVNDERNYFYCRDIENTVLEYESRDWIETNLINKIANYNNNNEVIEESDKFQKLVNKFNSNIASIWSKTGDDSVSNKNDNIWSFDSSFSSNQSSATPSPKPNAIDFWSSIAITEINECLNSKRAPAVEDLYSLAEMSWESSLLQSLNAFPDDGFIDGTNDCNEETNWCLNQLDKSCSEANPISLQNHQKNSPFIEFNALLSTPVKPSEKDCALQLSKLLSMASLMHKTNGLSPAPDENLLTSSKTHFQPIKQDSFDRDESDEGSVADMADDEVNKLVICSDKCPNNGENASKEGNCAPKLRPLSTSLDELASFMGPFTDLELTSAEVLTSVPITEEMEFKNIIKDNKMSDKSTNTETEPQMDVKPKLEPILESKVESEPEYQDLYNMINEVLRNGIAEDESTSAGLTAALDDWYDSDSADNCGADWIGSRNREKRLSWNCYWDTYDVTNASEQLFNKNGFTADSKALKDDMCGQQMRTRYGLKREMADKTRNERSVHDVYDEVLAEELFYRNSSHINDTLEECPEYEEVFDDCCPTDDNDFDAIYADESRVLKDYDSDYMTAHEVVCDGMSSFGQPFHLQLKPRYNELPKRTRKPCTYFIEGNCNRIDCKYSHDISAITCKYWEEGFCFKADLCPFFHGYVADDPIVSSVKKKPTVKSRKSYAIESESDFPSLATVPNSDDNTPIPSESEPNRLEKQFFEFCTRSVADTSAKSIGVSKAKLPIAVYMKKKVKKRKDRNLQ